MSARKPTSLTTRHSTKAERSAREAGDSAMTPRTALTKSPPADLKGRARASAVWRRLIRLYSDTQGTIVTAFDTDLLVKYCLAEEELLELAKLRDETLKLWKRHVTILEDMDVSGENLKSYFGALTQANALNQRYQSMDARLDNKRKYLHTLSQSLYLTPRSRAGVAPPEKEQDPPKSEMGDLLDDE